MITNKRTLSSACATQIKELIFAGVLKPGEKIKGDYLKRELGIGLSPIREGLSRLIYTGLVECIDNVGFKVPALSEDTIYDNYRSYIKLEILLFSDAIENGTIEWESNIMGTLFQLDKIEGASIKVPYKFWSDLNDKFHTALIGSAKLSGLKQVHATLLCLKNWYHRLAYTKNADKLVEIGYSEHKKIAELAISRNTVQACNLLEQHMLRSLKYLIMQLRKGGHI